MTATVGSLLNTQEPRVQEILSKQIDYLMPGVDPIFRSMIVSSQGVVPASEIGRDMHIIKIFQEGLTGVIEQGALTNNFALYGDDTDTFGTKLHQQNIVQTFPDPTYGMNQTPYQLAIPLRSMLMNIMFTLGELTAEALPATIGEIVAPKMKNFAQHITFQFANYMYVNQNDFYKLGTISSLATAGAGPYYWTFSPSEQVADRFATGMQVDVYDSTGATRRNETGGGAREVLVVDYVDELSNEVRLVSDANTTGTIVDTDIVTFAQTKASGSFSSFAGLNSWIKGGSGSNDNYLLGADRITGKEIDVTTHPCHKSFTWNASGAALTEHQFRKICRRIHAAKWKYGYEIDTWIASDGVWLEYEATKIGREYIDRTGRLSNIMNEGSQGDKDFGGFKFTFDGKTYTGYTSMFVEDGALYGHKLGGNNWKRIVPPTIRGTKPFSQEETGYPVEFVAGSLTGGASNSLPIYSSSGSTTLVTEAVQMPAWVRMQLAPDQPCGAKITNLKTARLYSDN